MKNNAFYVSLILLLTVAISDYSQKKNILFIAIDDLKLTIGAYGDTFSQTPNIDKLASQETVFMQNYCQQAVCGPSRS